LEFIKQNPFGFMKKCTLHIIKAAETVITRSGCESNAHVFIKIDILLRQLKAIKFQVPIEFR